MTGVTDRAFNALNEAGWNDFPKGSSGIASDVSGPHSPPGVLRFVFPAGFAGGSSTGSSGIDVPNYHVLYVSYYVKYSSNWQGHPTGINKHGYAWTGSTEVFYFEADGGDNGPLHPRVDVQGASSGNNLYSPNLVPGAVFTRGQWDYVEYVLTGNSSGTADGTIDWYLNGVKVGHVGGIQWSSGSTTWNSSSIFPIWGGSGGTVTADQYIEFDHYYVSGKN